MKHINQLQANNKINSLCYTDNTMQRLYLTSQMQLTNIKRINNQAKLLKYMNLFKELNL